MEKESDDSSRDLLPSVAEDNKAVERRAQVVIAEARGMFGGCTCMYCERRRKWHIRQYPRLGNADLTDRQD